MLFLQLAQALAADLAGTRVDPNEAQKALAYLRTKQDGDAFFAYLRAIVRDGRAVVRSGQTLEYYRNLLAACDRHLKGLPASEMAQTLGWAIRLLRYYRAVPDAELPRQQQERPTERSSQPVAPTLPAIGEIFTGPVLKRDETLIVIGIPGFANEQVVGVLKIEQDTPKWVAGKDSARVEVISQRQRGNLTILNVKRAAPLPKSS